MISGGMFTQNDILGAAMNAAIVRGSVISNNITNADTPGYKKESVEFEEYLARAVSDYRRTGELDLSRTTPTVEKIHTNLWNRLDGNNVDINEENIKLYQNSVLYDALSNSVISNYKMLNLVFNMK